MSESWFDAEEDLQPAGAADRGQDTTTISEGQTDGEWLVNVAKALQL